MDYKSSWNCKILVNRAAYFDNIQLCILSKYNFPMGNLATGFFRHSLPSCWCLMGFTSFCYWRLYNLFSLEWLQAYTQHMASSRCILVHSPFNSHGIDACKEINIGWTDSSLTVL
ncbi:hypothetical protein NC652_022384 [Populus alba x Populus x berolinensis]|nr:hypothetical protein NC652_022384 [Populus alba x Populus x berolinensis]